MTRKLIALALLGLLMLSATVVKVRYSGKVLQKDAAAAFDKKDYVRARALYMQAGRWHLPFTGLRQDAAEHLLKIGDFYMAKADYAEAVASYDDARAVFYSTSSRPKDQLLDKANTALATALAKWRLLEDKSVPEEELQKKYERLAATSLMPDPWWSFAMGMSFISFLAFTYLTIRSGQPRQRLYLAAATAASLIVWIVSMKML